MDPQPVTGYKQVEYLSPSAITKWLKEGPEAYYLHYLTPNRPPREPQTQPMSIGSAFDAYCKSYLHDKLFGKGHTDSNRFDLTAIFEAQVEEQHRDWALENGKYVFDVYKSSGALADLLNDLLGAKNSPRFEFEVRGQVNGYREGVQLTTNQVTLLGKPDAAYVNRHGIHVVLDWKVNGYCSKYPTSPLKGYVRLRGSDGRNTGCHKDCSPYELGGMTINIAGFLEHFNEDWARQLSIYAWLCEEAVGSDYIVAIDQMSCKPCPGAKPTIRVAEHRLRVSPDFQWECFRQACEIWSIVTSDHIFRNLTLEESQARCELLDKQAETLYGDNTGEGQHFLEMTRR
jgi:hypothetical protein